MAINEAKPTPEALREQLAIARQTIENGPAWLRQRAGEQRAAVAESIRRRREGE